MESDGNERHNTHASGLSPSARAIAARLPEWLSAAMVEIWARTREPKLLDDKRLLHRSVRRHVVGAWEQLAQDDPARLAVLKAAFATDPLEQAMRAARHGSVLISIQRPGVRKREILTTDELSTAELRADDHGDYSLVDRTAGKEEVIGEKVRFGRGGILELFPPFVEPDALGAPAAQTSATAKKHAGGRPRHKAYEPVVAEIERLRTKGGICSQRSLREHLRAWMMAKFSELPDERTVAVWVQKCWPHIPEDNQNDK